MNATTRQYLFGAIFLAVGAYQIYTGSYLESSLYILAAFAFIVNTLAGEPKLARYKKPLVIATWTLMIVTALVFLYVIQFNYL